MSTPSRYIIRPTIARPQHPRPVRDMAHAVQAVAGMLNTEQAADLASSLTALIPTLVNATLAPLPPIFETAPASGGVALRVRWDGAMEGRHIDTAIRGIKITLELYGYVATPRPSLRGPRAHAAWLVTRVSTGKVAA